VDWNNDGKLDIVAGDTHGQVWVFLNEGSAGQPVLGAGRRVEADGGPIVGVTMNRRPDGMVRYTIGSANKEMGVYSKLHVADLDADGLKDLLIGQTCGDRENIVVYKNIGTAVEPKFGKAQALDLPGPALRRPSPYLVDWDGDGRPDLLCGTEEAKVWFFRNVGTAREPKWDKGRRLDLKGRGFDQGYRCRIAVTDWNEDGVLDLLVGNRTKTGGNVWLFLGK
jgi:hypothetical protein